MREELEELVETADNLSLPVVPEALVAVDQLHWGTDWADVFSAIERLAASVAELERQAVRMARLDHRSWEEIGDYVGLTRHGARKRYGLNDLRELDELDELHDAEKAALLNEVQLHALRARAEGKTGPGEVPLELWEQVMEQISRHTAARTTLIAQLADDE